MGLDLCEVRWLGKTFTSCLLSSGQPGSELLDTSSVFSPELDIVGVLVTLNFGVLLELSNILGDSGKLILECLSISWNLVSLGEESCLSGSAFLDDFKLSSNIFLKVHGPGDSVFREHGARGFLDVLKLSSSSILPCINGLKGVVKRCKGSDELFDLANSGLEAGVDLKLLFHSLDFLGQNLLLVLWDGDGHGGHVGIDGAEKSIDGVCALLEKILSLLKISIGSLEVKDLLDLLDFLFSNFKFSCNGFIVLSVANESILCFIKKLKSLSGLGLGVIPTLFNPLDISLEELGFVGVLEDDLAFVDEVSDNVSLGVELLKGLFLSLNELINILNARSSSRTPTNPSSSRLMSRGLKRVGMTPRPRPERDFNFLMKQRMLSLATLRTMKPLQLNLKLLKRKSRRSRRSLTSRLPMLILRRDKIFSRRAQTPSMDFSAPSMPTWPPCPSPSQRTRRRF